MQRNEVDVCPENSRICSTDFTKYNEVLLDPDSAQKIDPNWIIRNKVGKGGSALQCVKKNAPA